MLLCGEEDGIEVDEDVKVKYIDDAGVIEALPGWGGHDEPERRWRG